ncbi:cadherin-like domain-containing protein [Pseudomonas stutzeri]|nr:cadherin-like domain-containing protein [Stutzerimonas stutzeri]
MPLVTLAMLRLSPSTSLSLPSRSAAAKVTGVSSVAARLSSLASGASFTGVTVRVRVAVSVRLPSVMAATEDTPVTFAAADLLGNDSDVDGDSLSIASVTSGTGGSAVLNADGTVTFTPDADFNGVATFSYM